MNPSHQKKRAPRRGKPAPEQQQLDKLRDASNFATLVGKAVGTATEINEANSVLISQIVFEEMRKPAGERDEERLVAYMKLALQAWAQVLRSRAVDLGYNRFKFDAAKRARECVKELREIDEGDGDEREKIEKAMVVLFGPKPIGFTTAEEEEA